ncbi:MAG: disulfide bond formation protein B [Gammaproteobacteria bacterium]|nr:disulfide bond formation protein B [Gammaproteobacteria bacterium]MDH3465941.1 disulfide bond formation protein B [Gammaproteobacteria bacterium]
MTRKLSRTLYSLGFLACAALIGVALYFEHIEALEPCPLCIVQRVIVILIGIMCLIAAVHNPRSAWRRLYELPIILFSMAGATVAARHVWIQNLPADQIPECGPGLEFMLKRFPLHTVIEKVLSGSGECAEVVWTWLGLSIPGWTLVFFIGFAITGFTLLFSRRRFH